MESTIPVTPILLMCMRTINKYKTSMRLMYGVIILKVLTLGLWDMIYQQERKYPDSKNKRMYPNGGWRSTTIISNSIGQGEVLMILNSTASMMATAS
jgi:penicillin-binding protein 2